MIRSGTWKGLAGGGMSISVIGREVRGKYCTKVGRPSSNETFDLIGTTDGKLIGFSVIWNDAGEEQGYSVTSWCGRYERTEDGAERIHTLWHLCSLYTDKEDGAKTELWDSFHTNADWFEFDSDSIEWT